jgi:hypothetical protein
MEALYRPAHRVSAQEGATVALTGSLGVGGPSVRLRNNTLFGSWARLPSLANNKVRLCPYQ